MNPSLPITYFCPVYNPPFFVVAVIKKSATNEKLAIMTSNKK
jgi:hypothetical protein